MKAIDAGILGDYLDQPYGEVRQRGRELLALPELESVDPEISTTDYRSRVFEWSEFLAEKGQMNVRGGQVTLVVSSGPAQVNVPPVLGAQLDAAKQRLSAKGLEFSLVPLADVRDTARRYSSDLVEFPGMGHDLMLDEGWPGPGQALLDWLGGLN